MENVILYENHIFLLLFVGTISIYYKYLSILAEIIMAFLIFSVIKYESLFYIIIRFNRFKSQCSKNNNDNDNFYRFFQNHFQYLGLKFKHYLFQYKTTTWKRRIHHQILWLCNYEKNIFYTISFNFYSFRQVLFFVTNPSIAIARVAKGSNNLRRVKKAFTLTFFKYLNCKYRIFHNRSVRLLSTGRFIIKKVLKMQRKSKNDHP